MSRIRRDYEKTFAGKVERWLNGDDTAFVHEHDAHALEKREKEHGRDYFAYLENPADEAVELENLRRIHLLYRVLAVLMGTLIIAALLYSVYFLPSFGNADNPVNNEVSQRYIEQGLTETGAINIVAGMILDYRAYDTFGESNVLFIATCVVMLLMMADSGARQPKTRRQLGMKSDPILQSVSLVLVPIILMFGIYVILNGHLSPGGGFSGGALIGGGLILFRNSYGYESIRDFFTERTLQYCTLVALGFYGLAKSYSFFTGANHLESIIPQGTPGNILSSGLILPLNIAVGVVVACTMYSFYSLFSKGEI